MRDIKFRGKRFDNGAFENGSLVRIRCYCHDEQVFIADKMTGYLIPVDPDTVGQFTGLHDMNGKDIYEGDVVRLAICPPTYNGKNPNPYEDLRYVAWEQQKRAYVYRKIKEHPGKHSRNIRDVWMGHGKVSTVEVIGNIHDQPELMKGAEP